jgi:hypothetical protein
MDVTISHLLFVENIPLFEDGLVKDAMAMDKALTLFDDATRMQLERFKIYYYMSWYVIGPITTCDFSPLS